MANNIDQLNYYDPLVQQKENRMSEVWIANFSAFIQTLQGYLTQFGMLIPQVTTSQRNSIQSPVNGQMIYNTDTDTAEYFKAGVWTAF